jgi:hypothetical protein
MRQAAGEIPGELFIDGAWCTQRGHPGLADGQAGCFVLELLKGIRRSRILTQGM